jgi:hypothetical protein
MSYVIVDIGENKSKEIKYCLSNVAYMITSSRFILGFFPGRKGDSKKIKIVGPEEVLSKIELLFSGVKFVGDKKIFINEGVQKNEAKEFLDIIATCVSGHTHPLSFPLNSETRFILIDGESDLLTKINIILRSVNFIDANIVSIDAIA